MKAILRNMVWIAILVATGFLVGSQAGKAGVPPVHCSTSSITATIEIDGVHIRLHGITICSNGGVTLAGRGTRCNRAGIRTVRVSGRPVRISGISCR